MKLYAPLSIAVAPGPAEALLTATNVDYSRDPAEYNNATNYALDARVRVGDTVYNSSIAGNLGNNPATSPDKWRVVGSTNRLAMFDRRIGSQTVFSDEIEVQLTLQGQAVDTVSVINADAASVSVTQTDATDGLVYSETQALIEDVGDWWEYLYYPIVRRTKAVFNGLLPYRNSVVTVTISNAGSDAKCGLLSLGQVIAPGGVQFGASDGIEDYSVIQKDPFGIGDIVERDYADDGEFLVEVPVDESPRFRRFLEERRAKPTVFLLADHRPDAQYYGLPSFRRVFGNPKYDYFSVSVKGFT